MQTVADGDTQQPALVVGVGVGARWRCAFTFAADKIDPVLRAISEITGLAGKPADGAALELVREELLRASSAPPNERQAATVAALALWFAFNHPRGGYRESVAETLRRNGRAHLCVQTDADGLVWGFSVADRPVDLVPIVTLALSTGEEVSFRSLEKPVLN